MEFSARNESSHGTSPCPVETKSHPATWIAPGKMRTEHPGTTRLGAQPGVFAVDVVDAVGEVDDEPDRIDVLPHHVAGVPVEPERRTVTDSLERAHRAPVVVGDLARMHLMRETNAFVVEDVEDRIPPVGEVLVTRVHDRSGNRRELGDIGPDLRPGEADHGVHAELARHLCGELQLFGGALAYIS